MTTPNSKLASFLKKIAEDAPPIAPGVESDSVIDKSLIPGNKNLPFTQHSGSPGVGGAVADFGSNVWEGLKRFHLGTVAGVGGASILAGLLAYNMMKKKKKPAYAAE